MRYDHHMQDKSLFDSNLFFVCSKKKNADDDSRQDHISIDYRVNAVPFSDEWVAALEAVGEVS